MTVGLLPALTDEQAMLLDATVRFIEAEFPMEAVRERADGGEGPDAGYLPAAARLGWLGMLADEAHGGGSASGNGLLDAAIIAAERGARLQPGPFAGHSVVVHALSTAGSPGQRDVLAGLVEGRSWATWVADGSGAGPAGQHVALRDERDGLLLDGTADGVPDAVDCEWLLVAASGRDGLAQVLVPAGAPGVTLRRLEGLDLTRRWCAVELNGVRLPAEALVGVPGRPTEQLVRGQAEIGCVLSAAEAVGAMDANFRLALDYAKSRIAFGRPIGSFQAIKHVLADTSLFLEMSKAIVAAAAGALGRGAPDGPALAHAAKSFVGERGIELTHTCFQVFGGIGYTWEHDQHLFMRRLAAEAAAFGPPAWHRERLFDAAGVG
jgi:alkylation response protein AidB-like acyl-CoA dehydrogenase